MKVNFWIQEDTAGRIADMAEATRLHKGTLVDIAIELLQAVGVETALATLNGQPKRKTTSKKNGQ